MSVLRHLDLKTHSDNHCTFWVYVCITGKKKKQPKDLQGELDA